MSFTFLLWLQLPFTDGSALLYENVTEPYVVPLLKPIAQQIANNAFVSNVLSWCVNGVHLTILYIVFILLPGHIGSFICIMLATCYPIMASIVAVTTDDTAVCAEVVPSASICIDANWSLCTYACLFVSALCF